MTHCKRHQMLNDVVQCDRHLRHVAAQGKTVVLISLEMSELMYAKRISSGVTQIPLNELQDNSTSVKEKVVKYQTNHPKS